MRAEGAAFLFEAQSFDAILDRAKREVEDFQKEHPLRRGMQREELRSRLDVAPRVFPALLREMTSRGVLAEHGAHVSTPGWTPSPSPPQKAVAGAYLTALKAAPYSPPVEGRPDEEMVAYLVDAGAVVDVGAGVVFEAAAYNEMATAVIAKLRRQGTITLAEVRNMFDTSRRYSQALLEHLDQRRVTVRRGDERVLGPNAERTAEG